MPALSMNQKEVKKIPKQRLEEFTHLLEIDIDKYYKEEEDSMMFRLGEEVIEGRLLMMILNSMD